MASLKRKYSAIERELARALTIACEAAKSEIVGFEWLTHRVDYTRFPESLIVTWVFDSDVHHDQAISGQAKARMQAHTLAAFEEIGISVKDIARHVEFDSQERCEAQHGGDWAARIDSRQRKGSRHGQGH
ncbi:hypothetical protein [Pseudomonas sp. S2_C03]